MGFSLFPGQGVPAETATAARKIYNIQHIYLRIGDEFEAILEGVDLAQLDPSASLNGEAVYRLALVTAFQYAELLPDPLAEQATINAWIGNTPCACPSSTPALPRRLCAISAKTYFLFPTVPKNFPAYLLRWANPACLPNHTAFL